jgi:hypothetical protein
MELVDDDKGLEDEEEGLLVFLGVLRISWGGLAMYSWTMAR